MRACHHGKGLPIEDLPATRRISKRNQEIDCFLYRYSVRDAKSALAEEKTANSDLRFLLLSCWSYEPLACHCFIVNDA